MRFHFHQNAAPLYAPATRSQPMAPTAFATLPNQQAGHRDGAMDTWVIGLKRSTLAGQNSPAAHHPASTGGYSMALMAMPPKRATLPIAPWRLNCPRSGHGECPASLAAFCRISSFGTASPSRATRSWCRKMMPNSPILRPFAPIWAGRIAIGGSSTRGWCTGAKRVPSDGPATLPGLTRQAPTPLSPLPGVPGTNGYLLRRAGARALIAAATRFGFRVDVE